MKKVMTKALVSALIFALATQNMSAMFGWFGGKQAQETAAQEAAVDILSTDAPAADQPAPWSRKVKYGIPAGVTGAAGLGVATKLGYAEPSTWASKAWQAIPDTGAGSYLASTRLGGWATGATARAAQQLAQQKAQYEGLAGALAEGDVPGFGLAESLTPSAPAG